MRGATPPLPQYFFMAWCLVKETDNFIFNSLITFMKLGSSSESNNHSVKKFPAFYGTLMLITVFTKAGPYPKPRESISDLPTLFL
jgi:hypothetical protein